MATAQQILIVYGALSVVGSSLFVAGATLNWRQGIGDHFAARSPGWYLLAASGGPHLFGAGVVLIGVVRAAVA